MASLSAAAEVQHAPVRRRPPRPQQQQRVRRRRRVSSGVGWIAVFGVLLAGVVAVNVAVLQANLRLDKLGQQRAKLQADNAALASQVSAASAVPRTVALAAKQLGLVQASPDQMTYVEIRLRPR